MVPDQVLRGDRKSGMPGPGLVCWLHIRPSETSRFESLLVECAASTGRLDGTWIA